MRRLFVNADDCGLTDGVTEGIALAMRTGFVGGTTAMVCPDGAMGRLARLARPFAGRIGLHLQLTGGRPCLPPEQVPSLVGPDGAFPRKKIAVVNVDPDEVRREWRAQLARLRSLGIEPSHLDAHHHIHKRPEVFPVFLELARELGVPARAVSEDMRRAFAAAGVPHAAACVTTWFAQDLTGKRLLALVDAACVGLSESATVEVMTHPGFADAALGAISSYAADRQVELAVLTDAKCLEGITERGFTVILPAAITNAPAG